MFVKLNVLVRSPYSEEDCNTLSHALGTVLALVASILLIHKASTTERSDTLTVLGFSIFGLSLVVLFLASTLYHAAISEGLKKKLKVIDHSAIYLLIAGTYTAFCLTVLRGTWGYTIIAIEWLCATTGIVLKTFFTGRFKIASTISYIIMGWVILIAFPVLLANMSSFALTALVLGGLLYSIGTVFYSLQRRVKFFHSIWHIFVLLGAASHVAAALAVL